MLALDIGGANIKASDGESRSLSRSFPMWRDSDRLDAALRSILDEFPETTALAVTMTGELADCFATKAEGVRHILAAVAAASGSMSVAVWTTGGEFVSPEEARELIPLVAAANWHALATWAARSVPRGCGLLIDIGSTTTDIIPLSDGVPIPTGRTDLHRLLSQELVYSGVRRTPVCAVRHEIPFRTGVCSLAAEVFATMLDVYLIVGDLPEDESDLNTANGRPATLACARDRLARMLCADVTEVTPDELRRLAQALAEAQLTQLTAAIRTVQQRLPQRCGLAVLSGEGTFLAERCLNQILELSGIRPLSLAGSLGPEHSRAACAFALARLARERIKVDP